MMGGLMAWQDILHTGEGGRRLEASRLPARRAACTSSPFKTWRLERLVIVETRNKCTDGRCCSRDLDGEERQSNSRNTSCVRCLLCGNFSWVKAWKGAGCFR